MCRVCSARRCDSPVCFGAVVCWLCCCWLVAFLCWQVGSNLILSMGVFNGTVGTCFFIFNISTCKREENEMLNYDCNRIMGNSLWSRRHRACLIRASRIDFNLYFNSPQYWSWRTIPHAMETASHIYMYRESEDNFSLASSSLIRYQMDCK